MGLKITVKGNPKAGTTTLASLIEHGVSGLGGATTVFVDEDPQIGQTGYMPQLRLQKALQHLMDNLDTAREFTVRVEPHDLNKVVIRSEKF